MSKISTLKRLWRIHRQKPFIEISEYGQLTKSNHHYSVSFASTTGMCGALTFPATDMGDAQARSYADSYSRITGLPVIDRRQPTGDIHGS